MTDRQKSYALSCQKLARIFTRQGEHADASKVYAMARAWMGVK
jgi:hypothetical protein